MHLFEGARVISNVQGLGPYFASQRDRWGIDSWYFIDGTLKDYFETYSEYEVSGLSKRVQAEAIAMEAEAYLDAEGVIVMSSWSAETLRTFYGVDRKKVHVVAPGANLPAALPGFDLEGSEATSPKELTVGFVGMYPERKGLRTIADAVARLRAKGYRIRCAVVGRCPSDILASDGVDYVGTIDKSRDEGGFVATVRSFDVGVQLSAAELNGIAALEYLRCGVPAVISKVGGWREIAEGGGVVAVDSSITGAGLAEVFESELLDPVKYRALRSAGADRSDWATWTRAAFEVGRIIESRN